MSEFNINIEPLESHDIEKAKALVESVIKDSFIGEGLDLEDFKEELKGEISNVQGKFDKSKTHNYHFLLAKSGDEIVGTIGYGPLGRPIQEAIKRLENVPSLVTEVMSVYINPLFQNKGIGSKLLEEILKKVMNSGYKSYSVSTGYSKGKHFWSKKLGEPTVILDKYFGDADCWVWIINL